MSCNNKKRYFIDSRVNSSKWLANMGPFTCLCDLVKKMRRVQKLNPDISFRIWSEEI